MARPTRAAPDRVRRSHDQTRSTLRVVLLFLVAAALAAAVGAPRWLPLHLLLAGGVTLAISGVSLMLTVTWSAAPAPPDSWVQGQRATVAAGAAGVALGREAKLPDAVTAVAGASYVVGLVGLAVLLVVTVRRGVERRFDVAVAAYVAAIAAGVAGVAMGVAMAVGSPSGDVRAAHVTANLLGLVGLVVGGTMPFFAATVGRSRMSPHATAARLALWLIWQVSMLVVTVVALLADAGTVAAVGLGGYAVGVGVVLGMLPRAGRRGLRWAGPRLAALWVGGLWWAAALVATALDAADRRMVFGGRWLFVLVVAGFAQILWGSLAYLLPMLRGGGHERLSAGFASTRSWVGFAAVNTAGASMAASLPSALTATAVAVWVLDGAWRAARVGTVRADRPTEE